MNEPIDDLKYELSNIANKLERIANLLEEIKNMWGLKNGRTKRKR